MDSAECWRIYQPVSLLSSLRKVRVHACVCLIIDAIWSLIGFFFQVLQAWNSYPFYLTPIGAHHVDFRSKTKDDPDWLVELRRQEVEIIQKWVGWALRKLLTQEYNKYQHNLPSRFVSDTLLIYINQCSSLGQLKDQFNLIQSIHLIQTVPIFAWFDWIEL